MQATISGRREAAHDAYQTGMAAAERSMADEFIRLVKAGDMHAPATFAALEKDFPASRAAGCEVKTHPTIASCAQDTLTLRGMSMADVMSVLAKVAYSDEPQQAAARALIERMADVYAGVNTYFEG